MKAKSHGWALKLPDGSIDARTFDVSRSNCWASAFWVVCTFLGKEWESRYYARWDPSIRAARKLGYRMVRVNLIEV